MPKHITASQHHGFTLVELLIVVAIIAILAAIAVPNFLEAQTRSKVSRIRADMRSLATALETYGTDHNAYPVGAMSNLVFFTKELTTPVAYIASVGFVDPLSPINQFQNGAQSGNTKKSLLYYNFTGVFDRRITFGDFELLSNEAPAFRGWLLASQGPDRKEGLLAHYYSKPRLFPEASMSNDIYDPTNGTNSAGDIGRVGGETTIRAALLK